MLSGCSSKEESPQKKLAEATELPVNISGQKNWSLYGADGILSFEDSITGMPSLVINGCYSMANPDGTYSLWSLGDRLTAVPGCGKLKNVGWCHNGLIPICRPKSRISVVDKSGRQVFEIKPVDGAEIMECGLAFSDDLLLIVTTDGRYGYIDTNGKVRIKPKYYAAATFSEGKAMVEIPGERQNDHRLYRFIDTNGSTLFDIPDSVRLETFRYEYGRVVARSRSGAVGFVDSSGKFQAATITREGIGQYDDKYFAYKINGDWGVAKFGGSKSHIEPVYETIEFLPDHTFLVQEHGGKYKVLDRNGVEKLDFSEYSYVKYAGNFGFICKAPGGSILLNKNGRRECDKLISKISLNRSASKVIRSDWYSQQNVFSQLYDKINHYGFDKFKIGMPISVFLRKEPREYLGSTSVSPSLLQGNSDVTFNVKVIADRHIVKSIDGRSSESREEFDKDAKIKIVQIDINDKNDSWRSGQLSTSRALRDKGFSLVTASESDGTSFRLYKALDIELMIFYNEIQKHARILILDERTAKEVKAQINSSGWIPENI